MRVNRTYSLDENTVKDLNEQVNAKHRSRFVDSAIQTKLYGVGTDVANSTGRQLVAAAMHSKRTGDKVMTPTYKIYSCNFCYHNRITAIQNNRPACTLCRKKGQRMVVKEWIV